MNSFIISTFFALALLAAPHSHAQSAKRMALVIGNAAYVGEKPLRNPGNDAQDVAAVLQRAGVQVQRHTNLGRSEMNRAIDSFMAASEGAELAIVYYSGHGMQASGEAFLIPTDAKIQSERDVRSEGIRLGELMDDLEARRIRNTLIIIDACRDNPYRSRTRSGNKGLARPKEMNGAFLVAYATADGTTADDGDGRNGKYTEQLLKQLSQPGKSLRDMVEDTQLAVERSTAGAQRPKNYGDTAKFRSLSLQGVLGPGVQIASVNPEPTGRLPQYNPEEDAWAAAKSANTAAGYGAYLDEYPNGRYASVARVARASLGPTAAPQGAPQRPVQTVGREPTAAGQVFKDCADCPEMVVIPAGSFQMGSNDGVAAEKPVHSVSVNSLALGKYEVTQGQWKALMGNNPSHFSNCGDTCPVEKVSWNDVQEFIQKLNQKTGKGYRLPSESEWEYACRAGTNQTYCGSENVDSVAVYKENSGSKAQPAGSKQPNAWGLYDMSGNVWEWTQDCWNDNYNGAPSDSSAWMSGNCGQRVLRGGSWLNGAAITRAAFRLSPPASARVNDGGFRLARIAP